MWLAMVASHTTTRCVLACLSLAVLSYGQSNSSGSADRVIIRPRVRAALVEASTFPRADLRVDVPVVLIPIHVTTLLGNSVTDLKLENFRVFEENVQQKIMSFAS